MNRRVRFAFLSGILLIALALNGAFPRPALAEDATPPPPDATEPAPTDPPPAEPAPTEAPTVATSPDVAVAPTDTVSDTSSDGSGTSDVSSALPPDTNLVVLDSNGNAVALSTTEAALIIATGDPMWCPSSSSPGGAGCTGSFSNFNGGGGLLAFLQANPIQYSGAGTIYVANTYSTLLEGGMIVIDGGDGYGITDLTIQGGWNFGLNQFSGLPSEFNQALQIINWNYDVTLNDLLFDAANAPASLTVGTTGNIELNDVEVRNNAAGKGAMLDNTAGAGSIAVNSSSFHDNLTIGIQALSNSNIALTEVDASNNDGSGAVLDNCGGLVTCSATFAGTVSVYPSTFNNNGYDGLNVTSNGYILTVDITANNNGQSGVSGSGAVLDNSLADDPQSVVVGYQYGNEFNNNLDNGLAVKSQGDITLYQVTADDNGSLSGWAGAGAYLDNTYGNGDTFVYNYNIYTHAYGEFNSNYADGLDVLSNGNVDLWYVIADDNGNTGNTTPVWGMGTYIRNCYGGLSCDGTGWVQVTGSEFNSNYSDGLDVYAAGDIDLTNVTANDNGNPGIASTLYGFGASLDNSDGTGGVSISNGEFGSYITGGNYNDGLHVYSSGDVYVEYVYAYDNGNTGNTDTDFGNGAVLDACLENAGACAGTGYVYVFASEFSGNYSNGLSAFASDNIWLNYYVSAEENGQGLNVGVGTGAVLVNNFTGATGSILLYGPITLNSNYANGLTADSNGDIYMTGVDASDNGDYGAAAITTSGSVTIDPSTFNSNSAEGVIVNAGGNIDVTGIEANDNGSYGALLTTTAGSVAIDGGEFNTNTAFGLNVGATDDITVANITAGGNGGFGALLATTTGAVSVDSSLFNSNTGFGLNVGGAGDISVTDVEAGGNGAFGALLATTGGGAVVSSSSFNSNTGFGLNLGAAGDVTLSDVTAGDNGGFGALVTTSAGSVSIDPGFFNSNAGFGLNVGATEDVELTGVEAGENGGFGALLTTSGGMVTVDLSTFDWNTGFGLTVGGTGDVALTDVSASNNGGYGASITATAGGVSIDPSSFDSNSLYGLGVTASGNVFVGSVTAGDNGSFGASLTSTGGNATVDWSQFNYNTTSGLSVTSSGDAAVLNSLASHNGTFGAGISSGGAIDVKRNTFDWNTAGSGLNAAATGDISLVRNGASHNGGMGAALTSAGNVVVQDPGTFDWNTGHGLSIVSAGSTSIGDISASNNGGAGAAVTASDISVTGGIFSENGGDGLSLASANGAGVICTSASGNTGYGIDANLPGVLFTMQPSLIGNGAGPLNVGGGGVWVNQTWGCVNVPHLPPGLPWNVIHVTTADSQGLNCADFGGTVLILPNWDHVAFPCPIGDSASLKSTPADQLPGALGDTYNYLSGLEVQVQPALNGTMTIDFLIPPAALNSPLMIMHWDGSQWVDRGGMPTKDNFFEITSSETGTYLLVSQ
ncbi:MAG TPA: right-handed parallel beta-helix repeat-containing protein [Anaerolineales bacterium]